MVVVVDSTTLPHPSSFKVSIELAREKEKCLGWSREDAARPRRGLRPRWGRWRSSGPVLGSEGWAGRAFLRRLVTAWLRADWVVVVDIDVEGC